jgi:hypothetical protein
MMSMWVEGEVGSWRWKKEVVEAGGGRTKGKVEVE